MTKRIFNNEGDNTLLAKFEAVFANNPQIAHFDVLVGYFHASGYFHIRPHLENIPKIRILVGIDIDKFVSDAQRHGIALPAVHTEKGRSDYAEQLEREINEANYDAATEGSIRQFIGDIESGKITVKFHPSRKLHAKIYIFRPQNFNEHSISELITGSSNLSAAGLGVTKNPHYEFNVSLRDYDDVKFAADEFEKLWAESVAIPPEVFAQTRDKTYLNDNFTPYEVYLKLLIEYFGGEIEFDPEQAGDLPKEFMRLHYQLDAMNQGYALLQKHNGFFLADVVGLGKTIIAILIARMHILHNRDGVISRTLIVTPPALKRNWETTVRKFGLPHVDYITTGSLHKVKDAADYNLVIADESHKFRNRGSKTYEQMLRICKTPTLVNKRKKVILVSATPLNNKPDDIRNQIALFQDEYRPTLDSIDLAKFFGELKPGNNTEKDISIGEKLRRDVIEPLIVRRTRSDLLNTELYQKDLEKQGIRFPKIEKPVPLLYELDEELSELYNYTVRQISGELSYMRYRLIEHLKPAYKKLYPMAEVLSVQLAHIMKCLLLKRMDSSFCAFVGTLGRFVATHDAMLKMINNKKIYIASKKIMDQIEDIDEDELIELLAGNEAKAFALDSFESDFVEGINKDREIFQELHNRWQEVVEQKSDPKLDKFMKELDKILASGKKKQQKLVVFSEAKETTEYLREKLTASERKGVLSVSSQNRRDVTKTISENFDANVVAKEQKNDYNILITTEVLAEGVNLHRANAIVNYDTPWNATRLMQRIGRINRIGTDADSIYIYNFFPTDTIQNDLSLHAKAQEKLKIFHDALGGDSQIYSPDEEVTSYGLFEKIPEEDNAINKRLEYLMEIRKFREIAPQEFQRIKNLPLKIRCGAAKPQHSGATITFLKNERQNAFYYTDKKGNGRNYDFVKAANVLQCKPDTPAQSLPKNHHDQVKQAVQEFTERAQEHIREQTIGANLRGAALSAKNYLNTILRSPLTTNDEQKKQLKWAIESIEMGRFPRLPGELQKSQRNQKKTPIPPQQLLQSVLSIIGKYGAPAPVQQQKELEAEVPPAIIISQSFV